MRMIIIEWSLNLVRKHKILYYFLVINHSVSIRASVWVCYLSFRSLGVCSWALPLFSGGLSLSVVPAPAAVTVDAAFRRDEEKKSPTEQQEEENNMWCFFHYLQTCILSLSCTPITQPHINKHNDCKKYQVFARLRNFSASKNHTWWRWGSLWQW